MASHQAREPQAVAEHFNRYGYIGWPDQGGRRDHALIHSTFTPGKGWKRYPIRKRISRSWARKLRQEGVTTVSLVSAGREADFRIAELAKG
jgi:hypothetical protein